MIYNYILENYKNGEPIFLKDLPGKSRDYLRQEMKELVDEGKMERLYNGVYYLPYTTALGTEGTVFVGQYIEKKYLSAGGEVSGYVTGMQLVNQLGFTTQNPARYEVSSNAATTRQRKETFNGIDIYVYKPVAKVTERNKTALQFLDLMSVIDKYSEVSGDSLKKKLRQYVDSVKMDFQIVKEYLPLYPDKVFRNIYQGGLIGELV